MVRKSVLSDVPAILELYREQFREMAKLIPDFFKEADQSTRFIEEIISGEDSDILVYENDGKVVGFILLQAKKRPDFQFIVNSNARYCYIMDIIVTEKCRGKGFGTELMNQAKTWAKERACIFINLNVLTNNTAAISLYERLGFTPKAQEMYCKI